MLGFSQLLCDLGHVPPHPPAQFPYLAITLILGSFFQDDLASPPHNLWLSFLS